MPETTGRWTSVRVVPHGLAPELLERELPPQYRDEGAGHTEDEVFRWIGDRRIVLCVGSWLRDHAAFVATARLLAERTDCVFVMVGKGLVVHTSDAPNLLLFDRGLSDRTLHRLYLAAEVLLLPLKDAAANNAILEAMAHGLPIVTTDLPATRYYTKDLVRYCLPEPQAYADALTAMLRELENESARLTTGEHLRAVARDLVWPRVAQAHGGQLYATDAAGEHANPEPRSHTLPDAPGGRQ